jgi:hypothetical protein
MCKITNKKSNISQYGGLYFINDAFKKIKLDNLIETYLGTRNLRAIYSYADISKSLLYNSLCGGSFVSDLNQIKDCVPENLKSTIPSHDTVEYASQELKVENLVIKTDKNITHYINENEKFNKLLPKLTIELGLISKDSKDLTLDFDHVINENEKQDAKKTYKFTNGYHPCFANIGNSTVYFENRGGNTNAKYRQKESLSNCFKNLTENNINISKFRADSASYQKEVIDLVEANSTNFYIRNVSSDSFKNLCIEETQWKTVELNYQKIEVASINYSPFKGEKSYRIVVKRTKNSDLELPFEELKYNFQGIITNDYEISELEAIKFYNQRGDVSENYNKNLLNDFNLNNLPFMDMDTNTVYMGFVTISGILFEWIKKILVANKVEGIELKNRVKRVLFKYINICIKITKHAKALNIVIYSDKKYKHLII